MYLSTFHFYLIGIHDNRTLMKGLVSGLRPFLDRYWYDRTAYHGMYRIEVTDEERLMFQGIAKSTDHHLEVLCGDMR